MISEFLNYLLEICVTAGDYAMALFYGRIIPDWHFVLQVCLIAVVFLGSAFLAATIAENRNHKMKLHFLLGLLVPYLYPVVLVFYLKTVQAAAEAEDEIDPLSDLSSAMTERLKDIKKTQAEERSKKVKRVQSGIEEENNKTNEVKQDEQVETEDVVQEELSVFTRRYFQDLAVDSSGAKAGPFKLVALNGSEFNVSRIKNIQKDMASFEVDVHGRTKNIRIRYNNIKKFNKIN